MSTLTTAHTPEQLLNPEVYTDVIPEDTTGPQMTLLPDVWPGTSSRVVVVGPESQQGVKTLAGARDIGAAVSITRHDYAQAGDVHQTSITPQSVPVILLEESARAGDHRTFAALAEAIDWAARRPDELTTAIDLALSLEMATLAIKLAQLGGRLFPEHERVQRAARVLAPPVVRAVRAPRARGLSASMAWFRKHASQYRGQWLAVREGQLLGTAASLKELIAVIGQGEDAISTIVARVL